MICGIPELHCTCASVSEVELNELSGWEGRPVSAGELSHHNRIFSGTTVGNAVLGRQNSNVQLKHFPFNGPFLKSDSKHSLRSYGAAYEIPDIPFKMEEVHKRRYKAKDNSSAHIRHYLSSYTYPNLENLIAQSLLTDGGTKSQFSSSQMVKPSLVVLQEPEKGNKNKYFPKPFDHISQVQTI